VKLQLILARDSGKNLKHLVFEAGFDFTTTYSMPGQFIEAKRGDTKGFFAIANSPEKQEIELLVKNEGTGQAFAEMKSGESMDAGPAMGGGFDLDAGRNRDVHLFSMGSGIAPLRALIQSFLDGKFQPSKITLWQGAFTREHLPFQYEYEIWEKSGIKIELCLDQENGHSGENVAQKLTRLRPNLSRSVAYWIGSKPFGEAVSVAALQLKLDSKMLFTNS